MAAGDIKADLTGAADRMLASQRRYVLPDGAREVVLIRHGSAGGGSGEKRVLDGRAFADFPLLPAGHLQAQAIADRLEHEEIAAIFVTPLQRTLATATPLAERTAIQPTVIPRLCEVHLGDWEHEWKARLAAGDPLMQRMIAEENWDVLPGSERMEAFAARIRLGIEEITAQIGLRQRAVAFLHGGVIGEICRQATRGRQFAFHATENASLTRLVVHDGGAWMLRCFNDVAHLGSG